MADRLLYLLEVHFNEDIQVYQEKGQMDKALFLADLWLRISSDQAWSRWNVAALYARAGEKQKALKLITLMVQSGEVPYEWFRESIVFEELESESEYINLMKTLREMENL